MLLGTTNVLDSDANAPPLDGNVTLISEYVLSILTNLAATIILAPELFATFALNRRVLPAPVKLIKLDQICLRVVIPVFK